MLFHLCYWPTYGCPDVRAQGGFDELTCEPSGWSFGATLGRSQGIFGQGHSDSSTRTTAH
eukprot:9164965-Alexandrium_andersonii.AAC.1